MVGIIHGMLVMFILFVLGFNNGIILQYGYTTKVYSSNRFDVIFPITFTNLNNSILATVKYTSYHYSMACVIAYNESGCTFAQAQGNSGTSLPINYFAIGY